jgi:hypothetical protein
MSLLKRKLAIALMAFAMTGVAAGTLLAPTAAVADCGVRGCK